MNSEWEAGPSESDDRDPAPRAGSTEQADLQDDELDSVTGGVTIVWDSDW